MKKRTFSVDHSHKKIARHRWVKNMLIFVSFFGLIGVMSWSYMDKIVTNLGLRKHNIKIDGIDFQKKEIKNPRFVGGEEQPYVITAKKAKQISDTRVLLETVKGDISLKDGANFSLLSDTAQITTDQSKLVWLEGNVKFFYDKDDTEIQTHSAFSDLSKKYIESKEFTKGKSNRGSFSGQNFHFDQVEQLLKLGGPAKVVLHQSKSLREKANGK